MGNIKGMSLYEYCMTHPEMMYLLDEFDYNKNEKTPHQIYWQSTKDKVWWYCAEHDYSWQAYVNNRTLTKVKMPCCRPNFASLFPNLLKEWDWEENDKLGIDPYTLAPTSHKTVAWKCTHGHKWKARIDSRTRNGSGCPECAKVYTSKAERVLLEYIKLTFPKTTHQNRDKNGIPELDILIPEINVAIEYDGYPWHTKKLQSHIDKLNWCNANKIILINIAEYKNTPQVLQEVQAQYTPNHRVLYYDASGSYKPEKLLHAVKDYFKASGVSLAPITDTLLTKLTDTDNKSREIKNSLWNNPEYQWLHEWITDEESITIAKAYTAGSAAVKIKLTCPKCGREKVETHHYITQKFQGCVDKKEGCGYRGDVPQSQIDKINANRGTPKKK